jgi:hypothetical protein
MPWKALPRRWPVLPRQSKWSGRWSPPVVIVVAEREQKLMRRMTGKIPCMAALEERISALRTLQCLFYQNALI